MFDCKCTSLKRLGENIQHRKKQKQKHNNSKNNRNKTGYPAHEPPRINIYRVEGWISCISVWCMLLFEMCFCLCYVSFCCFMCWPSLVKLLHLQSTKTHNKRNNRNSFDKKKENNEQHKTTNRQIIKSLSPSRNLRNIHSRSGRGLDSLHLCFVVYVVL